MKTLITYTQGNLYKVKWTGGGDTPQVLRGAYTSRKDAGFAIDRYMSERKEKVKVNAKD